jgi:hypothetical protein
MHHSMLLIVVTQRVPSNEMKENQKPQILRKQNSGGGEDHAAGHVLNDRPKIKTLQHTI